MAIEIVGVHISKHRDLALVEERFNIRPLGLDPLLILALLVTALLQVGIKMIAG